MRFSHVIPAAACALFAASNADAANCAFTGTTVYGTGASTATPYFATLSQVLAAATPPVNLVYLQSQSCAGVTTVTTSTALSSSAFYWTAPTTAGGPPVQNTCTPTTPVIVDVGVSDVYAATCTGGTTSPVPAGQKEFSGPIQAMAFVVHPSSNQSSISEEAAHVVFKDIGITSYTVSPWTDPTALFIRSGGTTGSGTRFMIGNALGFVDSDWSSAITNVSTSQATLLQGISADSAQANETLGTLSVTGTDPNRPGTASTTQVKELAFQAQGQTCGYLPDSSSTSFDKLNVREGRYVIWGPVHLITAVSSTGVPISLSNPGDAPTNAAVKSLIDLVTLDSSLTDTQAGQSIAAAAQSGVIADCAMRVQRTGEVTTTPVEYSYAPPEGSCGCYWESQTSTAAPAGCNACPTTGTCASKYPATPVCHYGYCEAF
jgi:hypothetical protein